MRPRGRSPASLATAVVWLVGAYGASLIGYLGVNAFAVRALGGAQYASFLVLTTVALVAGQLALFGAHRAGLREASRLVSGDRASLAILGEEASAIVVVAVPSLAVMAGLAYLVTIGPLWREHALVACEFSLLICGNAWQKLGANYLRGLGRVGIASFVDGSSGGALTLVVQMLFLAILAQGGATHSLGLVLGLATVGYLPSVVIVVVLLRSLWVIESISQLLRTLGGALRRYRVFAAIQVVGFAGASLEIWLAALTLAPLQAAYFGAAQRLALMFSVPLTALQSAASPAISRLALKHQPVELERALRSSATFALVSAVAIAVPVVVAPGWCLSVLFGASFGGSGTVLVVLVVGQLVNVATGMCAPVLVMSRFEGAVAWATSLGLVARVAVGIPLALIGGGLGLASGSAVISSVVWVYLVYRAKVGLNIDTLPTGRPTLASLRTVGG